MPTNPQIVQCDNCDALKAAFDRLECTIIELMRNKYSNISFNTSLYFSQDLLNKLIRWKRVVENRLYNPKYPCSMINTQDIIKLVLTHAFSGTHCSLCKECFPPLPLCKCVTYSIFNQTTPTSPLLPFTYTDCQTGTTVETSVNGGDTLVFCACEGSVKYPFIYILTKVADSCATTTTTTTSTTTTTTTTSIIG